jgi:hypothetical protein
MDEAVKMTAGEGRKLHPSTCMISARGCSKAPGKTQERDKQVKYWMLKAEEYANRDGNEFIVMDLIECAWGWRQLLSRPHKGEAKRIFGEAEAVASRSNDYFFLAEFITDGGTDLASHKDKISEYIGDAENLAKTKEDWMGCSSIRGHFGESPKDTDRCWSNAENCPASKDWG